MEGNKFEQKEGGGTGEPVFVRRVSLSVFSARRLPAFLFSPCATAGGRGEGVKNGVVTVVPPCHPLSDHSPRYCVTSRDELGGIRQINDTQCRAHLAPSMSACVDVLCDER